MIDLRAVLLLFTLLVGSALTFTCSLELCEILFLSHLLLGSGTKVPKLGAFCLP